MNVCYINFQFQLTEKSFTSLDDFFYRQIFFNKKLYIFITELS